MSDNVNHPPHYGGSNNPYETIKVIEAWGLGFCLGNTVKYIARAGRKSNDTTIEDLKKARWYLDRVIARLEQPAVSLGGDTKLNKTLLRFDNGHKFVGVPGVHCPISNCHSKGWL